MALAFKSCGLCIKSGYIFVSSVVSRLLKALYELRRSPIAKQSNNPAIQFLVNPQSTNNTVKHSNTKKNRFSYTTILAVIRHLLMQPKFQQLFRRLFEPSNPNSPVGSPPSRRLRLAGFTSKTPTPISQVFFSLTQNSSFQTSISLTVMTSLSEAGVPFNFGNFDQ